ncbi:MAG: hypothetical protein EOS58_18200 [Mesorhizobium sp.]|nr:MULTISPECIES: hypothetical protein [unclassified Mesorhizobium]RVC40123.1 hypothetical protein EN781_30725 [Mesorhizobium sp. M4A.F.Ca.ET.090.04.2.1]RVD68539.1 hypothetical protein EN751_30875 [Mesorhizobium sp. M4A.F.Ca.ET.029.04.2.1]AZO47896.1 hypothetical protein EJ073_08730 [Mesorhizobium sp. M4B.F.Ca.ET.058.02.1.1]RUX44903.1 hypothetical protein EOA33_25515 [Mesorhizobium sp. M4A.F.Ca.ET.050.02.1.1]RVC77342.1 hypothetical protein EN745_22175 [Mesorhizobium sp. M4A.F.Ca.ET.022.05.2.1]
MKKLLLASVIAIASAAAMISPASADSLRLGIGIGPAYDDDYYGAYRPYYGDPYYRPHYRYNVYDDGYRPRYYMRHHRHCWTEYRKHWRHHHRVIEKIRICERRW